MPDGRLLGVRPRVVGRCPVSDHPGRQPARTADEEEELLRLLQEEDAWRSENRLFLLYPDTGPLRRELYQKHLDFFAAGAVHQERAIIASNRSGKSLAVCYELTCHLIGRYPPWWDGRRFDRPVVAWAAGEDTKSVRESLQQTLFGGPQAKGTGLIPRANLGPTTARGGVPEAIDSAIIKSDYGGYSRLVLKTYDQNRESFQAAKIDIMVFDEEPPLAIYTEGLTRVMSTVPGQPSGIVMCAFTPLRGLSGLVLAYMPGGERREGVI